MVIHEMSHDECVEVLRRTSLARLACCSESQPYIVQVHLVYKLDSGFLYGFTTLGQKVEWMRANPRVCVLMDEITAPDQWVSVVIFGRYEEVTVSSKSDVAHDRPPERPDELRPWSAGAPMGGLEGQGRAGGRRASTTSPSA